MTAGILFLIASRLMPFPWAALVALIAATSPHSITFSGYILTETLFTFLLTLSIYAAVSLWSARTARWALLFTVFAVLAALVRPAMLLFPFVTLLFFAFDQHFSGRRAQIIMATVLATIMLWAPWQLWELQHRESNATNAFAASLALGSYPDLIHHSPQLKGYPYREDPEWGSMSQDLGAAIEVISRRACVEPLSYLQWYGVGKAAMFFEWSILVGQGGPFVYPVLDSIYHKNTAAYYSVVLSSRLHLFWVFSFAALAGYLSVRLIFGRNLSPPEALAVPVVLIVLYFVIIHVALAPLPRYAVPIHGFLFVSGVFLVYRVFTAMRTKAIDQ